MKIKATVLALTLITGLISCNKTSSPDGRAQLRDSELADKIDQLNKKQIAILDSLQILDKKIEAIKATK